ncbi:MAG: KTSC domain-containing protein [Acetobacter sp.]|jgi:hypothetical protein|nr:KTSC domain-containing protein [Acetobacter sp.]MCH4061406.1 KTSC domain-containing protein [Acetobacter sp.]
MAWQSYSYFESSNVQSARYEDVEQILEVTFHNGGTYQYYNVPVQVAVEFEQAESKGGFLARAIKGHYRYAKV